VAAVGEQVTVPVGRYAIQSLSCSIVDQEAERRWSFSFSRNGKPSWHAIEKDDSLTIDPIGKLDFYVEHKTPDDGLQPGEALAVRPRLFTDQGLEINSCSCCGVDEKPSFFGNRDDHCAKLLLQVTGTEPTTLTSHESGFA
jgi:hypothetical protein